MAAQLYLSIWIEMFIQFRFIKIQVELIIINLIGSMPKMIMEIFKKICVTVKVLKNGLLS